MPAAAKLRRTKIAAIAGAAVVAICLTTTTIPAGALATGIVVLVSPWLIIGDIKNRRISEFASLPALVMLTIIAIVHRPSLPTALIGIGTVAALTYISIRSTPNNPLVGPADVIVTATAALALAICAAPPIALLAVLDLGAILAVVYNALPARLGGRQRFYPLAAGVATSTLIALLPTLSSFDKLRPN